MALSCEAQNGPDLKQSLSVIVDKHRAGIFRKEGDMTFILNTDPLSDDFEAEGKRKKRNAVLDTEKLWPGGVIPYEISSYFDGEWHCAPYSYTGPLFTFSGPHEMSLFQRLFTIVWLGQQAVS